MNSLQKERGIMGEKILVVDDEREIADLVAVYLENEYYTVFRYYTAEEPWPVSRRRSWIWRFWM